MADFEETIDVTRIFKPESDKGKIDRVYANTLENRDLVDSMKDNDLYSMTIGLSAALLLLLIDRHDSDGMIELNKFSGMMIKERARKEGKI